MWIVPSLHCSRFWVRIFLYMIIDWVAIESQDEETSLFIIKLMVHCKICILYERYSTPTRYFIVFYTFRGRKISVDSSFSSANALVLYLTTIYITILNYTYISCYAISVHLFFPSIAAWKEYTKKFLQLTSFFTCFAVFRRSSVVGRLGFFPRRNKRR